MLKNKLKTMIHQFKTLNGDPHYVAVGMAIGVFIAITPTIPFHTVLAVGLAVIFKASKPAAIVGVWVSNPVTVVFLYVACYKVGHLFFPNAPDALASIQNLIHHLESDVPFSEKMGSLNTFISTQVKTFMIMNLGGLILGIPVGVISYFITRSFFTRMHRKKNLFQKEHPPKKKTPKESSGKVPSMTHPAQLLKEHHIFAGKESGQNFLVNPMTAQMIIENTGISDETPVLEIGPGLGGLTIELAKKTRYVTAVEKDSRLVPILQQELDREEFTHVKIIKQDILKADFQDLTQSVMATATLDGGEPEKKMVVIGNLPYNISSQILFRLVEHRSYIKTAFLMFQKELAQRIVSPPNSKDYSRLSAVVQYASRIHVVADIKPACFFPRPKVDSTVLAFRFFQSSELDPPAEKMLFRMIKAAFSKRRKTIKNAMAGPASGFEKQFIEAALNRAGIDPGCRAETLGVAQFIKLTKAVLALDREDPKIF